jgi:hypothetical protein
MNKLHLVEFLWTVISPLQNLCLHRTTQHRNTRTNTHASSGIRTHDPSNQAAKTYALDRAATANGQIIFICISYIALVAFIIHV